MKYVAKQGDNSNIYGHYTKPCDKDQVAQSNPCWTVKVSILHFLLHINMVTLAYKLKMFESLSVTRNYVISGFCFSVLCWGACRE